MSVPLRKRPSNDPHPTHPKNYPYRCHLHCPSQLRSTICRIAGTRGPDTWLWLSRGVIAAGCDRVEAAGGCWKGRPGGVGPNLCRNRHRVFRHLLRLVGRAIYPDPGNDPHVALSALRPGPVHFLRRMKEDLVDYDGKTRLFKGRTAHNHSVALPQVEYAYYQAALDMVEQFFPPAAQPLARMSTGRIVNAP
jgi:hypothetical protein